MPLRISRTAAAAIALCAAVLAAVILDRAAPFPAADVRRGSEDAFAEGLYARELVPRQGPQRWTTDRAAFRFRHLPAGLLTLEVALHGQRGPVVVAAAGVVLGVMPPGTSSARFEAPAHSGGTLVVELRSDAFAAADGRRLGALLDRVAVGHAPPRVPSPGIVFEVVVPALVLAILGMAAGLGPWAALLLCAAASCLQCALLWPCGLVRSDEGARLCVLLTAGAILAAGFAHWTGRRVEGAGPWAFAAAVAAILVQGAAATSPSMVVSDAVFHANKLAAVAGGDFFPTSRTQHALPFTIPYGVSFYALLAPFYKMGFDPVRLVRGGAAAAGVAGCLALYRLLAPWGARRAALAVLVLLMLPGTFEVYSYGNLSNVFGQAATAAFFAWWVRGQPSSWPLGALLLALGALGHLSSLVVLLALCAALVAVRRGSLDRPRLAALAVGAALAGLYYLQFAKLVADQLPRLLEGGGQGRGVSRTAWDALRLQLLGALGQWGLPAAFLALVGRPRPRAGPLDRDLWAFWIAGLALAVPAVVSPLDVRYLYALTLPLAAAAASGLETLAGPGRSRRLLAWALLAWQGALAAEGIVEGLLYRYRP